MIKTVEQEIAFAQNKVSTAYTYPVGNCLGFSRDCLGSPATGGSASTAMTTAHRQTGPAPLGAFHWWTGGTQGFGHITVDAGGGYCYSTDFGPNGYIGDGRVRKIPVASISQYDNLLTYRGWSTDLDGYVPLEVTMILVQKKDGGPFYHYTGNHIEQISDHQALRAKGMGAKLVILNDTDEVFTTLGPPPYAAPVAASGTVASHDHPIPTATQSVTVPTGRTGKNA